MSREPTREEKLRDAFLVLGAQYFAHARYSARFFYLPVSATLFHHAIEMLLKGYLCATKTSGELKGIGHDLNGLWQAFKSEVNDPSFSQFDTSIGQLDKVELLRYPDSIVDDGYALHVSLGRPAAPIVFPGMELMPRYTIEVSELDDIAAAIFDVCQVASEPHFRSAPTEYLNALPPALWRRKQ
jgi:hypothetical protein